jgi:hypothetical protein
MANLIVTKLSPSAGRTAEGDSYGPTRSFTSINAYASIAGARNAALAMAFALEAYGYSFVDGDAGLLPLGGSQVVSVTLYKNNTYSTWNGAHYVLPLGRR